MAACEDDPKQEVFAERAGYDAVSHSFGDEPVDGACGPGAYRKKPAQSALDGPGKRQRLDILDELRMLN